MTTQSASQRFTSAPLKVICIASLTALLCLSAQGQTTTATNPSAMPMTDMPKGVTGSTDMKGSMMMGMEEMQKMPMSGNTDKDFAMMMKIHHQQALNMAEMQLKNGKSPEMKTMAKQIITAQKNEITQFDKWLTKQK